jgi:hypothetical protein
MPSAVQRDTNIDALVQQLNGIAAKYRNAAAAMTAPACRRGKEPPGEESRVAHGR